MRNKVLMVGNSEVFPFKKLVYFRLEIHISNSRLSISIYDRTRSISVFVLYPSRHHCVDGSNNGQSPSKRVASENNLILRVFSH